MNDWAIKNNQNRGIEPKYLIETDRLLLREIILDDAPDMLRLHSIPEVQKYTGDPVITSQEEIREKIEEIRTRDYQNHGFGRWATFLKDGHIFVGWAGLVYLPEFDEVDLGYRFLPEFWGQGIATEASLAILDYGFNTLKLERIVAIAMKEHKASIRVMEKVGMTFEKYAPYEPGSIDAAWYSKRR